MNRGSCINTSITMRRAENSQSQFKEHLSQTFVRESQDKNKEILQEFYRERYKHMKSRSNKKQIISASLDRHLKGRNEKDKTLMPADISIPTIKQHNLLRKNISIFKKQQQILEKQKENYDQNCINLDFSCVNISKQKYQKLQNITPNANNRFQVLQNFQSYQLPNGPFPDSSRRMTLKSSYKKDSCEKQQKIQSESQFLFDSINNTNKAQKQIQSRRNSMRTERTQNERVPLSNLLKKYENQYKFRSTQIPNKNNSSLDQSYKFSTENIQIRFPSKSSLSLQHSPISFKGQNRQFHQNRELNYQENNQIKQNQANKNNQIFLRRRYPYTQNQTKNKTLIERQDQFQNDSTKKNQRISKGQSEMLKLHLAKIQDLEKKNKQLLKLLQQQKSKNESELKNNHQQAKLIQSMQKMRKTLLKIQGNQKNCDLKELWRWVKALPNHK